MVNMVYRVKCRFVLKDIHSEIMLLRIVLASGMCHLMPQFHPPEWGNTEEQAFEYRGKSDFSHLVTLTGVCHRACKSVIHHFIVTLCKYS